MAVGRRATALAGGVLTGLGCVLMLAVAVVRADLMLLSPAVTTLDLAVGLLWILVAVLASGAVAERLLAGCVGVTWLFGSLFEGALTAHQGVLLLVLLAFPSGRLPGRQLWVGLAVAVAVTIGVVPQLGVAALFAVAALVVGRRHTVRPSLYPPLAAGAVAAALSFSWWSAHHLNGAPDAPVGYLVTIATVGLLFPIATGDWHRRADSADWLLAGSQGGGLPGLQHVLRRVLRDPSLRIQTWNPAAGTWCDLTGEGGGTAASYRTVVPVSEDGLDGKALARVLVTTWGLDSQAARDGVADAVRLSLANDQLRAIEERQLADLVRSSSRLIEAGDRERGHLAQRLRAEVERPLHQALQSLDLAAEMDDPELATIQTARHEVGAALLDLERLVVGPHLTVLGEGRLGPAVDELAARCPVPVTVRWDPTARADTSAETSLFFVVSEGLANVVKHSGAHAVTVDIACEGDSLVLRLADDGIGGADPQGSGLRGLADRMFAVGGRLRVSEGSGGGTVITAQVPASSAALRQ